MEQRLSDPDLWLGGWHYELGLEVAPAAAEEARRKAVLSAVWESPPLAGVARSWRDVGQPWLPLESVSVASGVHYYGYVRLDADRSIGCGSVFSNDGDVLWFVLYIPLGMLELVYPVVHPFALGSNPWHREVDDLLVAIARRIYPLVEYRLAAIGQEASAGLPLALHKATHFRWMAPCLLVPDPLLAEPPTFGSASLLPEGIWLLKNE